jgi:gamma-glutamylcysteine synthetase
MAQGGTKKMKIRAIKDTGEIIGITEDDGTQAIAVEPEELSQIYESGGFKYVALILHAHSSPG